MTDERLKEAELLAEIKIERRVSWLACNILAINLGEIGEQEKLRQKYLINFRAQAEKEQK